ncbi:MAG: sulfatase, partial [Candidatus Sumerlaeota bacterium]|nr:sulfatase [Candidatus Sumerlaeota bacterium]
CNGYRRRTSPNIDAVAADGVNFTSCYCANSPCVPARANVLTGRFGFSNGVVTNRGAGPDAALRHVSLSGHGERRQPLFVHHLWTQGMKTVSFSCFLDRHNAWWFAPGWEELHTFTRKRGYETADEVNAACLPWLRAHGREDNWFLHVHYWDLHSYYRIPRAWAGRFADDPPPAWPDAQTIEAQQDFYGPRCTWDMHNGPRGQVVDVMPAAIRNLADFKLLIDGYDGAIAFTDHHVGQLLAALDELGVLRDTAIIVSGDHGDSFGDHGQWADHGIANEAVHHIPMIVRWPGAAKGIANDGFLYNLDLCATLCDMLGFPTPPGWQSVSFARALRGESFAGRPYLVWDHGIFTLSRSVRTRRWMMMQMLHPGLYPYDDPFYLYDMEKDPHQTTNLAGREPDVYREMHRLLGEWRQEQAARGEGADPLEAAVAEGPFMYRAPAQMLEALKRRGRDDLADDLRGRMRRLNIVA